MYVHLFLKPEFSEIGTHQQAKIGNGSRKDTNPYGNPLPQRVQNDLNAASTWRERKYVVRLILNARNASVCILFPQVFSVLSSSRRLPGHHSLLVCINYVLGWQKRKKKKPSKKGYICSHDCQEEKNTKCPGRLRGHSVKSV